MNDKRNEIELSGTAFEQKRVHWDKMQSITFAASSVADFLRVSLLPELPYITIWGLIQPWTNGVATVTDFDLKTRFKNEDRESIPCSFGNNAAADYTRHYASAIVASDYPSADCLLISAKDSVGPVAKYCLPTYLVGNFDELTLRIASPLVSGGFVIAMRIRQSNFRP